MLSNVTVSNQEAFHTRRLGRSSVAEALCRMAAALNALVDGNVFPEVLVAHRTAACATVRPLATRVILNEAFYSAVNDCAAQYP